MDPLIMPGSEPQTEKVATPRESFGRTGTFFADIFFVSSKEIFRDYEVQVRMR